MIRFIVDVIHLVNAISFWKHDIHFIKVWNPSWNMDRLEAVNFCVDIRLAFLWLGLTFSSSGQHLPCIVFHIGFSGLVVNSSLRS